MSEPIGEAIVITNGDAGRPVAGVPLLLRTILALQRAGVERLTVYRHFADLDAVIGGLRKGRFSIVGGRASMGKSQLAKQIAANVAQRGIRVGIVAIEEDGEKLAENYLANFAGVVNNPTPVTAGASSSCDALAASWTGSSPRAPG